MPTDSDAIIALERRFWDALVAQDAQAAIDLLVEPALMVSGHGVLRFGHEQYRQMADHGPQVLQAYRLRDIEVMFPSASLAIVAYGVEQQVGARDGNAGEVQQMFDTSTWVRIGDAWKCVMHTESAAQPRATRAAGG